MRIGSENRLGSIVAYETYLVIELNLHGGDLRRIESLQNEGMDMSNIVPEYLLDRVCLGVLTVSPEVFANARIFYQKSLKKLRVVLPRAASDAKAVHRHVMFGPKDFRIRGEGIPSYGRRQEPESTPSDDEWEEWEEI
jgi:hypothetical protein